MGRDRSETGIGSLGTMFGLAALLVVLLIVSIVVAATLPSPTITTTSSTTSTSAVPAREGTNHATSQVHPTTTAAGASGTGGLAVVVACRSDVSDVQTALAAYQASNGSDPTPPAAWTSASYPTNFAPLTDAAPPGPFLKMPPGDNHYVIMWDSSGRIWVEPPGTFSQAYDATNDATNPSTCTRVAR